MLQSPGRLSLYPNSRYLVIDVAFSPGYGLPPEFRIQLIYSYKFNAIKIIFGSFHTIFYPPKYRSISNRQTNLCFFFFFYYIFIGYIHDLVT